MIELHDPREVDLNKHAVIEASAGTGKTYTIQHLVRRLIVEQRIPLDRILVVTFTEKATGELKERIRATIEEEIRHADDATVQLLQQSLDAFDEAPVYTIHGFCQRVLQQYAFENRQDFRLEIVDDHALCAQRLREQQRRDWLAWFRDGADGDEDDAIALMEEALEISNYPALNRDKESGWESTVLRLAVTYRPGDDELLPRPLDLRQRLIECRELVRNAYRELATLLGPVDPHDLTANRFFQQYSRIKLRQDWRESRIRDVIRPLLASVARFNPESRPLVHYIELMGKEWEKLQKNLDLKACPNQERVAKVLLELEAQLDLDSLRHQLAVRSIRALQEDVRQYKREHGQISFADMIDRVDEALDETRNRHGGADLLAALRHRYQVALVDEFQDTDPVQWRIFRRLFVDANDDHRLLIIGDPKQAIYGFRGADVQAYLDARKELCERHGACEYSLPNNYRSREDLIQALNCLFKQGDWFAAGAGIAYSEVRAPKGGSAAVCVDESERAPLTIVRVQEAESGGQAKGWMYRFIAMEIQRLLDRSNGPVMKFRVRQRIEEISAGHICVLVRAKSEAQLVERALARLDIPHSRYKKPGLWQSAEALHLSYLLRAIANPEDLIAMKRALLTRFFHVPADGKPAGDGRFYDPIDLSDLWKYEDLPPEHAVKRTLADWRDLASQRRWAELFRAVLQDTGVLYDDARADDGERRIANYHHMIEILLEMAMRQNLDIHSLSESLDHLRDESLEVDEDESLHRIETEKPKVQILTMHTSKGLEFPIVFVAGGFSGTPANEYHKYRNDDGKIVYDLCASDDARHKALEEQEQQRLYYVALTRAMYKLYVPWYEPKRKSDAPVARLLHPAIEKSIEAQDGRAAHVVDFNGYKVTEDKPCTPAVDKVSIAAAAWAPIARRVPDPMIPRYDVPLWRRRIDLRSFSGMSAGADRPAPQFGDDAPRQDEDAGPITAAVARDPNALPAGKLSGDLLHNILQHLDFSAASDVDPAALLHNEAAAALIDRQIRRFFPAAGVDDELLGRYRRQCAQILCRTLRTPLQHAGALADVRADDRLHETPFHYPLNALVAPGKKRLVEEINLADGHLLTGVIDLVFRSGGKYFLLDWKSNTIDAGYGPELIQQNMLEHNYDLQYQIYAIAINRWLTMAVPGYDPAKHLGGVYYLYLRGMNGKDESTGVFFSPITADDLHRYEADITRTLVQTRN